VTANRPLHLSPDAESEVDHAIAWYNLRRDGLGFEFWVEVRGVFENIRMNHGARRPGYWRARAKP
jgi:hypothetical protein